MMAFKQDGHFGDVAAADHGHQGIICCVHVFSKWDTGSRLKGYNRALCDEDVTMDRDSAVVSGGLRHCGLPVFS
jgi:hypothetical protein